MITKTFTEDGESWIVLYAETEVEIAVFDSISKGTRSVGFKVHREINEGGKFDGVRPVTFVVAPEIAPCQEKGCRELGLPLTPVSGSVAFEFFCHKHIGKHEGKV